MDERIKREQIEKAVAFVVDKFINHSREITKPVLCHSLRVGFHLYDRDYPLEVIIAGFLHDIIEDTFTSKKEISSIFGDTVAELVDMNSKNLAANIHKREMIDRCIGMGEDALIIKSADIIENIDYSLKQNWEKGFKNLPVSCKILFQKKPSDFTDPIFEELRQYYLKITKS